jgi:hypothetical protein
MSRPPESANSPNRDSRCISRAPDPPKSPILQTTRFSKFGGLADSGDLQTSRICEFAESGIHLHFHLQIGRICRSPESANATNLHTTGFSRSPELDKSLKQTHRDRLLAECRFIKLNQV